MTGTWLAGILIIAAVVVAGLVIWLGLVFWAGKHPYFKHPTPDQQPGDVRGGRFLGEGRAGRQWHGANRSPLTALDSHPRPATGRD